MHVYLVTETLLCVFLDACEDAHRVGLKFVDSNCVRRVERQSDHRLLRREVNANHHIVVSYVARLQFLEVLRTLVYVVMVLHLFVCNPDRAQASGLGSHDVDTVTEVDRQLFNARTCELEHLVLHSAALECSLNERDSHVVRTYALLGLALEPYEHHFRCVDVPCVLEQLLHELAAAFANAHVTERTVACVRVGTENHVAALHHHLASILVDDSLVGRNVDAAVLLSC